MSPNVGSALPDPRTEPAPRPRRRPGRHLRPVARPVRRRSPAVPVLVGAGIVITALFALAVMHALLIGGQIQLDGMQRQVASESEEIRRLRLRVAELEAPDRVLEVARTRLGMVQPAEVGYLAPAGVQTGDDTRTRVEPAVLPPPEPEPETDATADATSAEEREVAEALAQEDGASTATSGATTDTADTTTGAAPDGTSSPGDDRPVAGGGDE